MQTGAILHPPGVRQPPPTAPTPSSNLTPNRYRQPSPNPRKSIIISWNAADVPCGFELPVSSECVSYTRLRRGCRPAGEPPQQPLGFGSEESSRSGFGSQALGTGSTSFRRRASTLSRATVCSSPLSRLLPRAQRKVAGQRTSGRRRLSLIRALRSCDCNCYSLESPYLWEPFHTRRARPSAGTSTAADHSCG